MNPNANTNTCTDAACGTPGTQTVRARRHSEATFRPEVDIYETADEFVILANVPGASAETLDLTVEHGTLLLRAPVSPRWPEGATCLAAEYGVGNFERSFRLGEDIDSSRIGAELRDGVLTLRLPKGEQAKPRRIAVQAV